MPEGWAVLHAWRVLGLLRAVEAVEPLLQIALQENDANAQEMAGENLPNILPRIGPGILSMVSDYLVRTDLNVGLRMAVSEVIKNLAVQWPESRADCVTLLTKVLDRGNENPAELNGVILGDLLDLKAVEAAPTIKRVCEAGYVDESIAGGWPEAEYALGLTTVPPPRRHFDHFARFRSPSGIDPFSGIETGHTPKARAKNRARARRKQSRQSRKRNRKKQ